MASVSVAEFQQYMQAQASETEALTNRIDQLQQSNIEVRGQVAAMEMNIEEKFIKLSDAFSVRMAQMETGGNQLISDVQVAQNEFQILKTQIQELLSNAETNFARQNNVMEASIKTLHNQTDETFMAVNKKFEDLQANYIQVNMDNNAKLEALCNKTELAFQDVQTKLASIRQVSADIGGDPANNKAYQQEQVRRKGFLPIKSIVPRKINDKMEDWRIWKEDTVDFFDTQLEGMGHFLVEIVGKHEGTAEELNNAIIKYVGKNGQTYNDEDSVMVWRALKRLTEGVAQRIVMNTRKENGFVAWNNLGRYFEPRLALQQGAALQELTRMILTRAKNPEETRRMMVTYQSKVKDAEDHNRPLDSDYLKSVLGGFIDDTTRIGTVECQHKNVTAETFEKKILEFINGVAAKSTTTSSSTTTPMAIGAVVGTPEAGAEQDGDWWYGSWQEDWPTLSGGADEEAIAQGDSLWALNKGKGKEGKGGKGVCHGCGSPSHYIANCPLKGKGKGNKGFKGSPYQSHLQFGSKNSAMRYPKGSSKGGGGGKGPRGGCWKCGGPHYASECGAEVKPVAGHVRVLAALRTVQRPEEIHPADDVSEVDDALVQLAQKSPKMKLGIQEKAKWRMEAYGCYVKMQNRFDVFEHEDEHADEPEMLEEPVPLKEGARAEDVNGLQISGELDSANAEAIENLQVVSNRHGSCKKIKKSRNQRRKERGFMQRSMVSVMNATIAIDNVNKFNARSSQNKLGFARTRNGSKHTIQEHDKSIDFRYNSLTGNNHRKNQLVPKTQIVDECIDDNPPGLVESDDEEVDTVDVVDRWTLPPTRIRKCDDEESDDEHGHQILDKVKVMIRRKAIKADGSLVIKENYDVHKKLNTFITIEPEGVNTIQNNNGWELITMYVDSGATETVIAEQMLSMMDIKESPQSKRGVEYEVANGKTIPNLGQKQFVAHADDGTKRQILAQVCEVNKALLSVSKVVSHGNKVVFGELDAYGNKISYIEDNETKERLWIQEENGMYALKMWVRSDGKEAEAPF